MNAPDTADHALRPVVVAPTYNNAGTVIEVLARVEAQGLALVVVNDGSTDGTAEALETWANGPRDVAVAVVTHEVNRGKAAALQSGFAKAAAMGCSHAVSIDTDLQHAPEDIPLLLEAAREAPTALVLGAREGDRAHQPRRRRVARGLANRLITWACGRPVADTQSGLRVYPLELVTGPGSLRCRSGYYAYETELIVRSVWAGRRVVEVPIAGRYLPAGASVSHFRAGRDSLRWAVLMAWLLAERVWRGRG